jgi:hypothetical protein
MILPNTVKPGAAFKLGGLQQHPRLNQKIEAWAVIKDVTDTHVDYLVVDKMGRPLDGGVVHATRQSFQVFFDKRRLVLDSKFDTKDLKANAMQILSTTQGPAPVKATGFDALFLMNDGESFTPEEAKAGKFDPSKARRLADSFGGEPVENGGGRFLVKLEMTMARTIKAQQENRTEEIVPHVEQASLRVLSTEPAKPDNSIQILSTKVRASFDSAFMSQVVKAAEKYLGVYAKIAPRVGQVAQVFVYDWEDLETDNKETFEKHLRSFYASCILAEQGITVEKQDEKEVNELSVRSKIDFRNLMGGVEFQAMIWDDDAIFDIQWTTNSAVFCLVER